MAGALKTLYGALQASSYMSGISLLYGEEEINDTSLAPPMVLIVPRGGPIDSDPGYAKDLDPTVDRVWAIRESLDIYLWGLSTAPGALPIDHADATETLRQLVLSALQDQRAQFDVNGDVARGLWFKAVSQRWETPQGSFLRYGRALILTVTVEISETTPIPPYATVITEDLTTTITAGP